MTYAQINDLLNSSALLITTTIACHKAANDILNEATNTTNHTSRYAWAKFTHDAADISAKRMMKDLVWNGTIQAGGQTAADSDVQFVVNSFVDKHASAYFPNG